jgi:hypothetical protein
MKNEIDRLFLVKDCEARHGPVPPPPPPPEQDVTVSEARLGKDCGGNALECPELSLAYARILPGSDLGTVKKLSCRSSSDS